MKKQIAVLDSGFVYVGDCQIEGDWLVISNAQNVRRWGTSAGLGELAVHGPQKATVLNAAGTVRAPLRSVIHTLDCEASKWI